MTIEVVRIDETTWTSASANRRRDFRMAIRDLVEDPGVCFRKDGRRLEIVMHEQGAEVLLFDAGEVNVATASIPHGALRSHIQTYLGIVRQIEEAHQGMGSVRVEALDMAKKLAHDDAGRCVENHCRDLQVDHGTGRRLFTLLLTLRTDASRLAGLRSHRRSL